MAGRMPTIYQIRSQRKASKENISAQQVLAKMMDPMYKQLNDAYIFNLSLEQALVYNLYRIIDSKNGKDTTCNRLNENVLYLETKSDRYELVKVQNQGDEPTYKFSKVLAPHLKDDYYFTLPENLPLRSSDVRVLFDNL